MYNLTARFHGSATAVTGISTEAEVQKHACDVLAACGIPLPDSLTGPGFAARLAATGEYRETLDDGRITVTRAD